MPDVGNHPAADDHVVSQDPEGPQKARVPEDLPQGARGVARRAAGKGKGVHAVGLRTAADDVFHENDRDAHEHHHGDEGEHIGAAAILAHKIRKAPSGAEADRRTGNGQNVCQAA